MNYYPFHMGDYATATRHLSWDEDAAYRRLLDAYYTQEKPLPTELRAVFRLVIATTDGQRQAVETVLTEFFELTEAGWLNRRAEAELVVMREKQQKQRDKANKRWDMQRDARGNATGGNAAIPRHAQTDAAASQTHADAMPPTPTPTPTPTPIEEEKRAQRKRRVAPTKPSDVSDQVWLDWCQLRKDKRATVTDTVLDGARSEAGKAGMTLEAFLVVWCRRGSQGLEAHWLRSDERGANVESFRERDLRIASERVAQATGGLVNDKSALRRPLPFERGYVETIEGEAHEQLRIVG